MDRNAALSRRVTSARSDGASFVVRAAVSEHDIAEVRRLVLAHAAVRATTPGVEYMRADAARMPGPYVPPLGGLWLALSGGAGIGCVALRPLDADARANVAEVKRMFVDESWRGRGVGRALMETLIAAAREHGYATLRLGTLADMTAAQGLYESLGFRPTERYRPDELVHTLFYELPLGADR
jgi:GNAT superfamily N-acetyltransferase